MSATPCEPHVAGLGDSSDRVWQYAPFNHTIMPKQTRKRTAAQRQVEEKPVLEDVRPISDEGLYRWCELTV